MAAMDTEKNTSGGTSTDASPKASAESAHLKGLQSLLNFLQVEVESRDMSSNDQQDDIGGKQTNHSPPMHDRSKRS